LPKLIITIYSILNDLLNKETKENKYSKTVAFMIPYSGLEFKE
jgi:hypothetical protein